MNAQLELFRRDGFYATLARTLLGEKTLATEFVSLVPVMMSFGAGCSVNEAIRWLAFWQNICSKRCGSSAGDRTWHIALDNAFIKAAVVDEDAREQPSAVYKALVLLLAMVGSFVGGHSSSRARQSLIHQLQTATLSLQQLQAIESSNYFNLRACLVYCISLIVPTIPINVFSSTLRKLLLLNITEFLCSSHIHSMQMHYDKLTSNVSSEYISMRKLSPFYMMLGRTANALCLLLHTTHTRHDPGDILLHVLTSFTHLLLTTSREFYASNAYLRVNDRVVHPEDVKLLDEYWDITKRSLFVIVMLGQEALSLLPLLRTKRPSLLRFRTDVIQPHTIHILRHLVLHLRHTHFITRKFSPPFQSYIDHFDALMLTIQQCELLSTTASILTIPLPSTELAPSHFTTIDTQTILSSNHKVLDHLLRDLDIQLLRAPLTSDQITSPSQLTLFNLIQNHLLYNYHFDLTVLLHPSIRQLLSAEFLLDYMPPLCNLLAPTKEQSLTSTSLLSFISNSNGVTLITQTIHDLHDSIHLLVMTSVEEIPLFTRTGWLWYFEILLQGYTEFIHTTSPQPFSTPVTKADHIVLRRGIKALLRGLSSLHMYNELEYMIFERLSVLSSTYTQNTSMLKESTVLLGIALNSILPQYCNRIMSELETLIQRIRQEQGNTVVSDVLIDILHDWDVDGLEYTRKEILVRWWNRLIIGMPVVEANVRVQL